MTVTNYEDSDRRRSENGASGTTSRNRSSHFGSVLTSLEPSAIDVDALLGGAEAFQTLKETFKGLVTNRETEGDDETSLGLSDSRESFRVKALDASPVEARIFKDHTKCFGLFFSSIRMERIFLDGQARLSVNVVNVGCVLLIVISIMLGLSSYGQDKYLKYVCSTAFSGFCPAESQAVNSYQTEGGTYTAKTFFDLNYHRYFKVLFPFAIGFTLVGGWLNWYIHRSKRIKEKSWALLAIFSLYLIAMIGMMIAIIALDIVKWPRTIVRGVLYVSGIFIFTSGCPSFTGYFIIWCASTLIFGVSYPISVTILRKKHEENFYFYRFALRINYFVAIMVYTMITVTYLVGGYIQEISTRKQFLQRILMANQQNEIIKQKTQNTKLQKKLLNNMLPESIVEHLTLQNFTIQSWDQLRQLSKRHSGVCIMFGELDGFTAFSAQVRPSLVMEYLNDLFLVFDGLCDDYDVYKVETVGDQYVAAVGVVTGHMHNEHVGHQEEDCPSHSISSSEEAQSLSSVTSASTFNTKQMLGFAKAIIGGSIWVTVPEGADVCPRLRVGIHTGTCMSGIVGTRNFRFCLFGDTMNTAARMEQKSAAECIHTTQDVVDLVPDECWEKLQKIEVKGKGLMQTYLLRVVDSSDVGQGDLAHDQSIPDDTENDDYFVRIASQDRRLFTDHSVYRDSLPITKEVYKKNTKWFGVVFRRLHVERAYLDSQARLYKSYVYIGYIALVIGLGLNVVLGYIIFHLYTSTCSVAQKKNQEAIVLLCIMFNGENPETNWNTAKPTYDIIINYSLLRMTPTVAGITAFVVIASCSGKFAFVLMAWLDFHFTDPILDQLFSQLTGLSIDWTDLKRNRGHFSSCSLPSPQYN